MLINLVKMLHQTGVCSEDQCWFNAVTNIKVWPTVNEHPNPPKWVKAIWGQYFGSFGSMSAHNWWTEEFSQRSANVSQPDKIPFGQPSFSSGGFNVCILSDTAFLSHITVYMAIEMLHFCEWYGFASRIYLYFSNVYLRNGNLILLELDSWGPWSIVNPHSILSLSSQVLQMFFVK